MRPNRLSGQTSPYLLQHQFNPVDWYPWGPEALAKAKAENKPIFLSIGYAACHWCHVMERESFENAAIATLLNASFIAINLNTGDIVWQVPLGEDPTFKKMGIPNSGMFNRGGGIATAGGLIFIGATGDNKLRAFDQQTGKVLWEYKLPGMASSIPSTYAVGSKQYVVVAVNGERENNFKGGYIAFAIP